MRAIITFHSIDPSGSVLSFPASSLRGLLLGLAEANLPVCDLDTLLNPGTARGVALTFDDGFESVFSGALPVLQDFGVRAHLFLTTSVVGATNRWRGQASSIPRFKMLSWAQVETCHRAGVRVESHTANHPDMRKLSDSELLEECERADDAIERYLGRRPAFFAYPFGYSDERVRNFARRAYQASVTTELRPLRDQEDLAALPRLDSYYLRIPRLYRRLECATTRAYLYLRYAIRELRGRQ